MKNGRQPQKKMKNGKLPQKNENGKRPQFEGSPIEPI